MVKSKFFKRLALSLAGLALASLMLSLLGWIPSSLVESLYARRVYPLVSSLMGFFGRAVGFSWLDLLVPLAILGAPYLLYRRKFLHLLGLVSAGYLLFFWTWGINYHRPPLLTKLDFSAERVNDESIADLTEEAAAALNDLYAVRFTAAFGDARLEAEAAARVGAVVRELDGTSWRSGPGVKSSWVLDPFFRAAGVEGMFNPFGHEAIVTRGLLSFEMPMVALHELAHVHGYPHEGDANFVALMAALGSSDTAFRYSGWLTLWFYLRSSESDLLLEQGPRSDVEAVYARIAGQRIDWVSRTQNRSLDLFLRANQVEGGVRSYAEIVNLAAGTRPFWDRFAE